MEFQMLLLFTDVPALQPTALPEDERESASFIQTNLFQLATLVDEFISTFDLAVHALTSLPKWDVSIGIDGVAAFQADTKRLMNWIHIAGRNGAILLSGHHEVIQANNALIKKCPTLDKMVDAAMLKSARKRFQSTFPHASPARTGAAHPGELSAIPQEISRHKATIDYDKIGYTFHFEGEGGLFSGGNVAIQDGTIIFSWTVKGKHVDYMLSRESVTELIELTREYLRAFRQASEIQIAQLSGPD